MQKRYSDQVEFFVVYIREAHPTDGWQLPMNEKDDVLFAQPTSFVEREKVAHQMCTKLDIKIPTLIDGMDDKVNQAYSAAPDRLYLIGVDGKVAYKGRRGPFGFKPAELDTAIQEVLGLEAADGEAAGAGSR